MIFGKHFTKYYFKYFISFLLGIVFLLVVDYAQLFIPEIVGSLIDGIEAGEKGLSTSITKNELDSSIIKLIIIAVVIFLGRFIWRNCIFGTCHRIQYDIRDEMFKHLEKMSVTYFEENKTGSLMALFTNDLENIRDSFGSGTLMLVDAIALGVMAIIKMINLSPILTLVCIIPLILVSTYAVFMRNNISKKVMKNLDAYSKMSDYVQETFTGIGVVKAFACERRKAFLFDDYNEYNKTTSISAIKAQVVIRIVVNGILYITLFILIFIGSYMVYEYNNFGKVTIFTPGKIIEFLSYYDSIIWPIMAIGDLINLFGKATPSAKRVSRLLDTDIEINDDLVIHNNISINDIKGSITFNDLTFKYPLSSIDNLEHISFTINSGEMIGIMGQTGCGKSTIVELLTRNYNVNKGSIYIDNYDLMELPLKTIRQAIACVPQESFLFMKTILENISFSKDKINEEECIQAAICADVDKDIKEFKDGYNTLLGEKGVKVSGGQRQRISIARALLKDSPILILDDALSAVDTLTESYIIKRLKEIRKNKTTIIIAHRITTLENLDRIIVMDDKKIDNIGTHKELLQKSRIYQNEVKLQEIEKEREGI